jgi:4-amino-4-deoxy-L-arabinose transferase-like glycosyltransferase
VLGWIVVFWRLGYASLLDPDEAHYAELTREMLQRGSWLVPLLDGKPFIDKPVLFHWLQALSVAVIGETEFAARLPTALAALAVIGTTRWLGAALFDAEIGTWGNVMLATMPATFALSSVAVFDMVFTAFLFGALACLLVAAKHARRGIEVTGYVLLTLAVMTKGPVALLLILLFFGVAAASGRELRARLNTLRWVRGLSAVALAASPWFVWMAMQFREQFVQGYLVAGNLWYFTQPVVFSSRPISHTFYIRVFATAFFPWSFVAAGRGIDVLRGLRRGVRVAADERLLWIWLLVVLGFFSAARFKLDTYIFPAAPVCCLLAARAWRGAAADDRSATRGVRWAVLAIAGALIVGGSFASVYLFELNLNLPSAAIALPIALTVGGIVQLARHAQRNWRTPPTAIVPVVTLLASYVIVGAIGFPVLEETRPTAFVARRLQRTTPASAPTAIYRLERWRASLRYYLDRPVQRLDTPDDVREFLSQPRPVYVVLLRREYEALRSAGLPIYPVMQRRAVVGTTGKGLRKQRWGFLVVASNMPRPPRVGE